MPYRSGMIGTAAARGVHRYAGGVSYYTCRGNPQHETFDTWLQNGRILRTHFRGENRRCRGVGDRGRRRIAAGRDAEFPHWPSRSFPRGRGSDRPGGSSRRAVGGHGDRHPCRGQCRSGAAGCRGVAGVFRRQGCLASACGHVGIRPDLRAIGRHGSQDGATGQPGQSIAGHSARREQYASAHDKSGQKRSETVGVCGIGASGHRPGRRAVLEPFSGNVLRATSNMPQQLEFASVCDGPVARPAMPLPEACREPAPLRRPTCSAAKAEIDPDSRCRRRPTATNRPPGSPGRKDCGPRQTAQRSSPRRPRRWPRHRRVPPWQAPSALAPAGLLGTADAAGRAEPAGPLRGDRPAG